jgi:hypothetical protein
MYLLVLPSIIDALSISARAILCETYFPQRTPSIGVFHEYDTVSA